MEYESCLWDNYDNGICGVVHVNRYSVEHTKTSPDHRQQSENQETK